MRLGTMLVAVFFAVCGVAAAVWLSAPSAPSTPSSRMPPRPEKEWPEIDADKDGLHPKAVAIEPEYDFGVMGMQDEASHTFVIRNDGDDPLVLMKGPTTCRCTLSTLGKDEVAPGESAEVTLQWKPDAPLPHFQQTAEIRTNDPEHRVIELVVMGDLRKVVDVLPSEAWTLGEIPSNEPAEFTGYVVSGLRDEFQILGVEASDESINATWKPLSDERRGDARSGYDVTVTVQPGGAAGAWSGTLKILTDIEGHETLDVGLSGNRQGPFQIHPLRGTSWNASVLAANLGRFPGSKGHRAELLMFVAPPADGEFKIEDTRTEPAYLKADVRRDEHQPAGEPRERYRITLEVPPGIPPVNHTRKNAGTVRLLTNHPGAPEIKLRAEFIIDTDS